MERSEQLFEAVLRRDFAAADELISAGVTLDGDIRDALVKGPSSAANFVLARYNYYNRFMEFAAKASVDDFAAVVEKLFGLVGEPLYNTFGEYRYSTRYHDKFYDPRFFETLLKFFDGKKMRKQAIMQEIIDNSDTRLLALCAKYGWLKMPRIRDAMIKYSEDKNKTECTAFLLDFKNRNFDLAAEREKAEKRMERELNADPNSVTELKKIWGFKKLEDGTLEITNYKGKQTEVAVPQKIGKDTVASIGEGAFSGLRYLSKRISDEVCRFRQESVTKITLPETITEIGAYAFSCCSALKDVNIPEGVKVIRSNTFCNTGIKTLSLPESVERLCDYALASVNYKEVYLPHGLTEIGKSAFQMCHDIERIEIPARVREILQGTFWQCDRLREVVLHEGIEAIKARAFWNCPALETINLPASIKKIENFKRGGEILSPFADSPKLTAIVEKGSYAEKYCAKNAIAFKYKEEA